MRKIKIVSAIAALCLAGSVHAAGPLVGPYKHLAMNQGADRVIKGAFGNATLTWAFATGECGMEKWGEVGADAIANANVKRFADAGIPYIISTGGQGGVFTCSSDAGMERFIKRYYSPQLAGIDFDIEAGQTAEQIASLVRQARYAQEKYPKLRYSFTVATHAASDGSHASLNQLGESILKHVRASGLRGYVINLMVMDYGPPSPSACVVKKGVCDMGRSAIQAVRNVHAKYGVPLAQIAVTAMIGVNDVPHNDTTLADARHIAAQAKLLKLAGVHYWSFDRDTPCRVAVKGASPVCSGLKTQTGDFGRAFGIR